MRLRSVSFHFREGHPPTLSVSRPFACQSNPGFVYPWPPAPCYRGPTFLLDGAGPPNGGNTSPECDGKPFNFAHLIFFSPTRGGLSAPVRAAQFLTRAQILLPNQALTASDPRLGLSALNG